MRSPSTDSAFDLHVQKPLSSAKKPPAVAESAAATPANKFFLQRESKWAILTLIGVLYIGETPLQRVSFERQVMGAFSIGDRVLDRHRHF